MKKNSSKTVYVYLLIALITAVVSGLMINFSFFDKLDYRAYDFLLNFKKQPKIDDRVVVVEIDDASIEFLGEWPWSRDVIADVLIRLKEWQAETAIFDIEYISPSKMGITPSATDIITESIYSAENNITGNLSGLAEAVNSGYYGINEIPELLNELNDSIVSPEFSELSDYIVGHSFRDNDEYFAKAIQFFGNAYLTTNTVNLMGKQNEDDLEYVTKRFLYKDIKDSKSYIEKDNAYTSKVMYEDEKFGMSPALHKLISRANGSGFPDSFIDADGVRRRMEPFYKFGDGYLGQLVFSPFLRIVHSEDVIRSRKYISIRNAVLNGEKKDLKIPLDAHGSILVNWKKGKTNDVFQHESIAEIILLDQTEQGIYSLLKYLYDLGISNDDGSFMEYVDVCGSLIDAYKDINNYKEELLNKCTGFDENNVPYDGITKQDYDDFYAYKNEYYEGVKAFLESNYYPKIEARLNELIPWNGEELIESIKSGTKETFDSLQKEYDFYTTSMDSFRKKFAGSYCILGNTATSTTDLGATPFENKFENVGIHATLLNTLLTENYIYFGDWYVFFAVVILLSLLTIFLWNKSNTLQNITCALLSLVVIICFSLSLVLFQYYVPFVGIAEYIVTYFIASTVYRFILSSREKRFITEVASSFANKDTVEELRKNPELFSIKGEKKCITALFTDIQKFSTFSESITKIYGEEGANHLIKHLNEYLGAMSNEILVNKGNIDKYEGDAIISMFGAPDPTNLHTKEEWAYLSLVSAINMKKVEERFNEEHKDVFKTYELDPQKYPALTESVTLNPFKTRIGINSGDAFVGMMGSKTESFSKLNYTMIGDTVNLAARLEGVNKVYGSWILCSEDTWTLANSGKNSNKIAVRMLDKVRVVGRSTPVQLYNVIGMTSELTPTQLESLDIFHAALERYFKREFVSAGKLFLQSSSLVGEDSTAILFAKRCKEFVEKGVPDRWDGVINLTSK